MSAIDREPFPKGVLVAAGVLILVAIAAAAYGRAHNVAEIAAAERREAQGAPVAVLEVRFSDRPDGSVLVEEAVSSQTIETIAPGSDGFIRGVMRGMAHARRIRNIDATPPFRLSRFENGTVILEDPETGRIIDLRAFGNTNNAAFARLMNNAEDLS